MLSMGQDPFSLGLMVVHLYLGFVVESLHEYFIINLALWARSKCVVLP